MKLKHIIKGLPALMIAASLMASVTGNAQTKKLPDGTVVYENGTKRLPNGTIIKKDGSILKTGGQRWPDGTVRVPGEDREVYKNKRGRYYKSGKRMPPGQAKKVYGGEAKDYAPGQQKKWKGNGKGHNGKHKD